MDELERELAEKIKEIKPVDQKAIEIAKKRWDSIAHPLHSLGLLEDAIVAIAGIQKTPQVVLNKKCVAAFCADNGVVAQGVTQSGQEVTAIVTENFCSGQTSVCAMTREQAADAILYGMQLVKDLKEEGYRLIATGEMGIGNTTTSSAILSVLLDRPVVEMTGRGAGLSSEGLKRKISAIETAIQINQPNPQDALDVLHKVGGLDIAGLVGVFLGGARENIPIVIDGVISAAAAMTAKKLCPSAADYWIAAHVSKEPAGKIVLDALEKRPMLTCDMCLGEGTGAVAAFPILDIANAVYSEMSTFSDIEMEAYQPLV